MIKIIQDGKETFSISGEDMIKQYEEKIKRGEIDPDEHVSLDGDLPQWIKDIGKND